MDSKTIIITVIYTYLIKNMFTSFHSSSIDMLGSNSTSVTQSRLKQVIELRQISPKKESRRGWFVHPVSNIKYCY